MAKASLTFDKLKINPGVINNDDFLKIAKQEIATTIARLTTEQFQGRNADGESFRAYSEAYKKKREAAGLGSTVTLSVTGDLKGSRQEITSVTTEGNNTAVGLYVNQHVANSSLVLRSDKAKKKRSSETLKKPKPVSNATIAASLDKRGFKDFHAIGKVDEERINKRIDREIEERLNKLVDVDKGAS